MQVARDSPSLGLRCGACHDGFMGDVVYLRSVTTGGKFVCPACGTSRPAELAYFDALAGMPFTNSLLLANGMERNEVTLPLGRTGAVEFGTPFDRLLYVNATPQAEFPVECAIQHITERGFVLHVATAVESAPPHPVRVVWIAAGYRGPQLPPFLDFVGRSFRALYASTIEPEIDYRIVVMEAAIGFEGFAAWFLESVIWKHDHFAKSKATRAKLRALITDAGITNLTEVPIRIALAEIDLYRVFTLLHLPAQGGVLTVESILSPILTGIKVRNDIAHRGRTHVDRNIATDFLAAVYFIIEAVFLNNAEIEAEIRSSAERVSSSPPTSP